MSVGDSLSEGASTAVAAASVESKGRIADLAESTGLVEDTIHVGIAFARELAASMCGANVLTVLTVLGDPDANVGLLDLVVRHVLELEVRVSDGTGLRRTELLG
jgi:hypothetical protein